MNKKIRIAYLTKDMPVNGITTVIMNYCRNIDMSKFQITIFSGAPIVQMYRDECTSLGVDVVELPAKKTESKKYYMALWKHLSKKKFDIVHVHGNSATITVELSIAMLKGIKVRIAHSHNSTCDYLRSHKILSPIFNLVYTHGFACSDLAGRWMFGNHKFAVLPNGFDTKKFVFDAQKRASIRSELGVAGKFVIGHVGCFNDQKNHPYLLKIFEKVAAENSEAYLLLVGEGPNFEQVNRSIQNHPYRDRIIYYGVTEHVEYIYDAIDVFVFPSKHEGLGIVLLEAQINGLPCVTSDVVPQEVMLGNRIMFLPLVDNVDEWKEAILGIAEVDRDMFYETYKDEIVKYDIQKNAEELEKQYSVFLKG